jgi:hypothetical protein
MGTPVHSILEGEALTLRICRILPCAAPLRLVNSFSAIRELANSPRRKRFKALLPRFHWVIVVGLLPILTVSIPVLAQDSIPTPTAQHVEEIHNFWKQPLAKSAKIPLEAELEKAKDYLPYEKYQVTYRSTDGVRIRAYLARPAGIKALAYYPDLVHTSCGDFYKMC